MKFSLAKHPRWIVAGAVVIVVIAAAFATARLTRTAPDVPTAEVRKGEFVDYIAVRGEVQALRSLTISAPIGLVGGDLQIVYLLRSGTPVKKGDVVCEIDGTNIQRLLDQRETELKAAEAEIDRTRANARMVDEQSSTDLLNATYNVKRAELDVSKAEILSEIDAAKTKLTLANYNQRLAETEQRGKSASISNNADIESRKMRRDKALYDVRLARAQLASLLLKAPADGVVTLLQNQRSGGRGVQAQEFKEGDRAWPGAAIAQLPDLSAILISSRVDESDRGRLKVGQQVSIRIDAVPDREFKGAISDISPLAKLDFSGWPITKNFDIAVKVDETDARIRPGMSASNRIILDRVPDSILVPNSAVFQKNGRAVVYVLRGAQFEERQVEIARRSIAEMVVRAGLQPGERVALKDPTMPQEQAK